MKTEGERTIHISPFFFLFSSYCFECWYSSIDMISCCKSY